MCLILIERKVHQVSKMLRHRRSHTPGERHQPTRHDASRSFTVATGASTILTITTQMRRPGRHPVLAAALVASVSLGFHSVESFCPSSSVIQPSKCRNTIIYPRTDVAIRKTLPRRLHSKLNAAPDENEGVNLLEPGNFPTIVIEEPPQPDIYKQAIERTLLWVGLAGVFGLGLGAIAGTATAEEFFAGYLVEQSLSVDNLFVFLLLFEYFQVPLRSQDRVLNWGIYGAVVMRALMIGVGAAALERFHAILLVFAGILVYSSAKTLIPGDDDEEEEDLNDNAIVKFSRKLFESTDKFDGSNFFTVENGVKMATPLFICMIALEISDVVFAVDSIPAVFGVTSVRSNVLVAVNSFFQFFALTFLT